MQVASMHHGNAADLEVLDMLTSMPTTFPHQHASTRPLATLNALRRPPIDPMVLAASLSSGPHVTRHHFHHAFGDQLHSPKSQQMPASQRASMAAGSIKPRSRRMSAASGSYANCDFDDYEEAEIVPTASSSVIKTDPVPEVTEEERAFYDSRQAPRSVRLQRAKELEEQRIAAKAAEAPRETAKPHLGTLPPQMIAAPSATVPATPRGISSIVRPPPIMVRCYARTRVPTPHGEVFCHLYKNNHDAKEHLALVIDPNQNDSESLVLDSDGRPHKERDPFYQKKALRSKTLDEVWGPAETDMERIVRGAYVGRLGPQFQVASKPLPRHQLPVKEQEDDGEPAPLVRIHSECFTGETIGSQRCDCGEQLDEAIRLISEAFDSSSSTQHPSLKPLGRGVVVYLRQEGRGIGLLDKLMAYNLQDMGHDTVSANILLGHLPDARKYDIASAILRDLGVQECRLLTNNPEKMEALEAEGIRVSERVGMVPRVWKHGKSVRRHRKASKRAKPVDTAGTNSPQRSHPRTSRPGGSSLFHQISALGMEASVISQADTGTESDSERDIVSAGLRHQGEDIENEGDRFESDDEYESDDSGDSYIDHVLRRSGTTMIGSSITKGPELEKYLRTKVERMGHLLALPTAEEEDPRPLSQPNTDEDEPHTH